MAANPQAMRPRALMIRWFALLATAMTFVTLALVWMLIDRNPGNVVTASFARITLEFEEPLVFRPESDGISKHVASMSVASASALVIEPCPFDGPDCSVKRSPSMSLNVVIKQRLKPEAQAGSAQPPPPRPPRFTPLVRTLPPKCRAKVDLTGSREGPSKLDLHAKDLAQNCTATIETTIFDTNASADGVSTLVMHIIDGTMDGHPKVREEAVSLKCALQEPRKDTDPHTRDCRITLRTEVIANQTKVGYVLDEQPGMVLLHGLRGSEPKLLSMSGELGRQAHEDTSFALCSELPGAAWNFSVPALGLLAVQNGRLPVLQATVHGYQRLHCTFPIRDFLVAIGLMLGIPALLLVPRYWQRFAQRYFPAQAGQAAPVGEVAETAETPHE